MLRLTDAMQEFYEPHAMAAHKAVRAYTEGLQETWYLETTHLLWEELDPWWRELYTHLAAHVGNKKVQRLHLHHEFVAVLGNHGWKASTYFNFKAKQHPILCKSIYIPHTERTKLTLFLDVVQRRIHYQAERKIHGVQIT